jgi:hypothetical protein
MRLDAGMGAAAAAEAARRAAADAHEDAQAAAQHAQARAPRALRLEPSSQLLAQNPGWAVLVAQLSAAS